jgi:hypothetical protein
MSKVGLNTFWEGPPSQMSLKVIPTWVYIRVRLFLGAAGHGIESSFDLYLRQAINLRDLGRSLSGTNPSKRGRI